MPGIIAPSVLSADFANLQRDVEMLNHSAAEWIHIDVMDGRFVPNISFGFPVLEAIRRHTNKVLDCHLMIEEPGKYLSEFKKAGADRITVHYEGEIHLDRTLQTIRELGIPNGLALNPHTPVDVVSDVAEKLDMVLLMSVNPGFGGQQFIQNTFRKLERLAALRMEGGYNFKIQVDGGVNLQNCAELFRLGADSLVAGNAVFKSENPSATIQQMLSSY